MHYVVKQQQYLANVQCTASGDTQIKMLEQSCYSWNIAQLTANQIRELKIKQNTLLSQRTNKSKQSFIYEFCIFVMFENFIRAGSLVMLWFIKFKDSKGSFNKAPMLSLI